MGFDEFESDLGKVAVTKEHIERERTETKDWERITENFPSQGLVDKVHFSRIDDMEYESESMFPNIRLEIDGEWMRMFFKQGDEARECFRTLNYRYHAFMQNYR